MTLGKLNQESKDSLAQKLNVPSMPQAQWPQKKKKMLLPFVESLLTLELLNKEDN